MIAYYTGNSQEIDQYPVEKLTHIIFSFCYLKDNKLVTGSADADARIKKLVSLKKKYPSLKILLSLEDGVAAKIAQRVSLPRKAGTFSRFP